MIAEWMTARLPEIDPHHSDITRFYPYARNDHHIRARCAEHFNKTYGIVHPREQWASERNMRCCAVHARTEALGAVVLPGRRLGTPALVREQRRARSSTTAVRAATARVGRALVVADHERRAPRAARAASA